MQSLPDDSLGVRALRIGGVQSVAYEQQTLVQC